MYSKTITIMFICVVLFLSGCAVLTENQINAVNEFAKVSENYGATLSNGIKAWADFSLAVSAVEAANMESDDDIVKHVKKSFQEYDEKYELAQKAVDSLKVLEDYSELLEKLSSDDYTKALDEEAKNLGEELDSGIELYNEHYGGSISTFGSKVTGIIRGIGGIYIRAKQAEALKVAVADAEPAIETLTQNIVNITNNIEGGIEDEIDIFESQSRYKLKTAQTVEYEYKGETKKRKDVPDISSFLKAYEIIHQSREALNVAQNTRQTAIKYNEVHKELVKSTQQKIEDVDDLKVLIKALKKEIDAGRKISK